MEYRRPRHAAEPGAAAGTRRDVGDRGSRHTRVQFLIDAQL